MAQQPPVAAYESQSPTLLAQQPPSLPERDTAPGKDWDQIFTYLEQRAQSLKMWRYSWWAGWSELARFILPERYKWLITANTMSRGRPLNNSIIDGTGSQAMEICASGLWTGLTSPSRPWFKFDKGLPWVELDADGKAWLQDTTQRVYTVLAQSNFYTTMAQAFRDVTTFGTAPVIIYEDVEDVIRCFLPCSGEFCLAAGSRLSVDTLYREFTLTVAQIVEMFRLENCPEEIRTLWEAGSLDVEKVVAHAIEPNFAIQRRGKLKGSIDVLPGAFTWRELYWLRGTKTQAELSRRGFHERPFMAARWSTVSNDPYGRSPGMKALGDIKQLQVETIRKGEFIEKLIRPPMLADPELQNQPSSILPGEITYIRSDGSKKGFSPAFEVHPTALAPMIADIEKIEERINRYFFVDIFMAISRMEGVQPRNQLELTKRDLERLQVLGPFITMFTTEFADPAIARILAIMERKRMLKPKPQSLANMPLKIEYTSILRLAQRSAESVAMKDFFVTAGELSSAAKAAAVPDPLRRVNLDKAIQKYADVSDFPSDCLFTDDEVNEHDAAREKAKAAAKAPGEAMAGVEAAKTLAQTPMGGGTALNALIGGPLPSQTVQ